MKTLGLIGGMSWESTTSYYSLLNTSIRERLGGLHSAKLLLWSVDFAEIAELQHAGNWSALTDELVLIARKLEQAGAEGLLICTNTMHKAADSIQKAVSIPLIHIADATGAAMVKAGVKQPGLLATRFTMEQDFYKERLASRFAVKSLIPDDAGRETVHRIIYDELCRGVVTNASKAAYLAEIARLQQAGADGIILGCTEIGLLIGQDDVTLPVFDTTRIHVEAAVDFMLS